MRSRIYRWYSDLNALGSVVHIDKSSGARDDYNEKLDQLEKNVLNINVPQPYAEGLFHLRMHIDMFRKKLMKIQKK